MSKLVKPHRLLALLTFILPAIASRPVDPLRDGATRSPGPAETVFRHYL